MMHLPGLQHPRVAPPAVPAGTPPLPRSPPLHKWLHPGPGLLAHAPCPAPILLIRHPVHNFSLKNIIGQFRVIDSVSGSGIGFGVSNSIGGSTTTLCTRWDNSSPPPHIKELKLGGGPSWCAGNKNFVCCAVITNNYIPSMYTTPYLARLGLPTSAHCTGTSSPVSKGSSSGGSSGGGIPWSISGNMSGSFGGRLACLTNHRFSHIISIGQVRRLNAAVGLKDQHTRIYNVSVAHTYLFASSWPPQSSARAELYVNPVHLQSQFSLSDSRRLTHPPSHKYHFGTSQRICGQYTQHY